MKKKEAMMTLVIVIQAVQVHIDCPCRVGERRICLKRAAMNPRNLGAHCPG